MAFLSPGVYVQETDASAIVPTVSNSMAFFAGEFMKGPIEQPFVITNKAELEEYFGKPNDNIYNQWFQCYKYLDYSNQLTISRTFTENLAWNTNMSVTIPDGGSEIRDLPYDGVAQYIQIGDTIQIGSDPSNKITVTDMYESTTDQYVVVFQPVANSMNGDLIVYTGYRNAGIDIYQEDSANNLPPVSQIRDLYKNYDHKVVTVNYLLLNVSN